MEGTNALERDGRIYVAGTQTLIGTGIVQGLENQGYTRLLGRKGEEPDLTDPFQVEGFFSDTHPEYVFLAAGKSGGIRANQKYPAELILDKLLTECNVIHSAYRHGVRKLLYLDSS